MFICKHCSRILERPSSIVIHEKACKKNPNRIPGKNGWSNPNHTLSEETRKKLAVANSKRICSEETKKKISDKLVKYLRENPDKVPYKRNHYSKGPSYPEKYWKDFLEKNNIFFQEELQVSSYRIDFAIGMIDLEVDGEQHYTDKRIVASDKRRTEFLEALGWKVIRIRWADYQKKSVEEKKAFCDQLLNQLIR